MRSKNPSEKACGIITSTSTSTQNLKHPLLGVPSPAHDSRSPHMQSQPDPRSLLFDPEWYLQKHIDVVSAGLDPVQHYLAHGAEEGRDPNPFFSTNYYLATNADVRASRLNPFLHFILYGYREGRDPFPYSNKTATEKSSEAPVSELKSLESKEPPSEEKVRETLLRAMFTATEATLDDNLKDKTPVVPKRPRSKSLAEVKQMIKKRP